jgi:hypothetical protein
MSKPGISGGPDPWRMEVSASLRGSEWEHLVRDLSVMKEPKALVDPELLQVGW